MQHDAITRQTLEEHARRRRRFLKSSATIAIAAPTVALLLADGIKPAYANGYGIPVTTPSGTTTPAPTGTNLP
jgi:hypothetical protein